MEDPDKALAQEIEWRARITTGADWTDAVYGISPFEAPSNALSLDEKLTDIIELLALIADGSAHRGANEARIREIRDRYGL